MTLNILWVSSRAEMLDSSTKKVLLSNENIQVAYIHQVACFLRGLLFISLHPVWEKITEKSDPFSPSIGHQLQLSHMKLLFVIAINRQNHFSRTLLKLNLLGAAGGY